MFRNIFRNWKKDRLWRAGMCRTLYFWPLIVAGGRLAGRALLNLWNMIEG